MADLKISQLPSVTSLTGDETVAGLQNGSNVQIPMSVLADFAVDDANLGLTTLTNMPGVLSPNNGILIPLYGYPNNPYSDATIQRLIGLIRTYHNVPVICVINPGSGPGTVWDGNYAATITLLQAAGATVIGYVSTSYAARDPNLVKADVLAWHTLYAATPVNGIFFDELPYDPGVGNASVTLYESYYNYVKSVGYSLIVANPGTNEQAIWYQNKVADIIVTWETSSWPAVADMQGLFVGGHSNFDWRVNAMLVYNQPSLDTDKLAALLPYVKWAFITDDNLPNPWDTIGSYAESLFAAISSSNASAYRAANGAVSIVSGNPAGTASGSVTIATGNVSGSGHTVGSITLSPGTASSSATAGNVILSNLPTADPHVVGAAWIDTASGRVLKVSAG